MTGTSIGETSVNEVYLMFRGRLVDANYEPGDESLEVKLMTEDEMPWDQIAFSVIRAGDIETLLQRS
jgi:hypothetical protein